MGWTRHAGAVVSLAMLASVVANYAVHRHFESRFRHLAQAAPHESPEALMFDAPELSQCDEAPPPTVPRQLETLGHVRYHEGILPALQTNESTDAGPSAPSTSTPPPAPVPVPNDPDPIDEEELSAVREILSPAADAVRNVIDDELSGASREERDIWFHELKSLPAGVVRDLLQVRKQLRSLPPALQRPDIMKALPARRIAVITAEPVLQSRRPPASDWTPTLAALEQASAVARHNLANSTTPGFKRFRVMLVDACSTPWLSEGDAADESRFEGTKRQHADSQAPKTIGTDSQSASVVQVEGVRLAPTILDLEQGSLLQTDRPLDLAIDGDGFFVALLNDRTVYTRCGAMILDAQRQISLMAAEGSAVLQPIISIPADAKEIQISTQGQVSVLRKPGSDPELVGQLQLARFASPTRLRPIGGTLLIPTSASGVAEVDVPDEGARGVIQQGCLEQSNADPEAELSELSQWQSLIKSLPAVSRPVTARGDEPASR